MWIISQDGFVSAVYKGGKLQLRARDRESLKRLGFGRRRIKTGLGTDYPYRAYTTSEELKAILCRQVDEIDYPNFKSQVHETRGRQFENVLHRVWSDLLALEPANAKQLLAPSSWRRPLPKRKGATRYTTESDWWTEYYTQRLERDTPAPTDEELEQLPDSMHDWTDDQWDAWLAANPSGV